MIAGLIGCSVAARMYTDYYLCSFLTVRVNLNVSSFLPSFLFRSPLRTYISSSFFFVLLLLATTSDEKLERFSDQIMDGGRNEVIIKEHILCTSEQKRFQRVSFFFLNRDYLSRKLRGKISYISRSVDKSWSRADPASSSLFPWYTHVYIYIYIERNEEETRNGTTFKC